MSHNLPDKLFNEDLPLTPTSDERILPQKELRCEDDEEAEVDEIPVNIKPDLPNLPEQTEYSDSLESPKKKKSLAVTIQEDVEVSKR